MVEIARSAEIQTTDRVVRVFPYALRRAEDVLEEIKNLPGTPKEEVRIVDIYLAKKSHESLPSSCMLIPVGGKINEGEDLRSAARRELTEEAALTPISRAKGDYTTWENEIADHDEFKYEIKGRGIKVVKEVALPVINESYLSGTRPNPEEDKIEKLVALTTYQLRVAFGSGRLSDGTSLVGSITTLNNPPDIIISRKQTRVRNRALKIIINGIETYEKEKKIKLKNKLLDLAFICGRVSDLRQHESFRNKDGKKKVSFEETIPYLRNILGDQFEAFFKEGYELFLTEEYMSYFRANEKNAFGLDSDRKASKRIHSDGFLTSFFKRLNRFKNKFFKKEKKEKDYRFDFMRSVNNLRELRLSGNLGVDFFHFLPLYASLFANDVYDPNGRYVKPFVKSKTTRAIVNSVRVIRDAIHLGLEAINYSSLNELAIFFQNNPEKESQKMNLLESMDNVVMNLLAEAFDTNENDIRDSWHIARRFIPELTEEALRGSPELVSRFQFHELRNEVANASLSEIILYTLGIDTKDNGKEWKRIRFEALRQLVIFLNVLIGKPLYNKEVQNLPNPIVREANQFFGPVDHMDDKDIEHRYRDYHGKGPYTIIDIKPVKNFRSFIRKLLQEKSEDIMDIIAINVILADENYKDYTPREKISLIQEVAKEFEEHFKNTHAGWKYENLTDDNTFDNYLDYINGRSMGLEGRRAGSFSDLIIRRQQKVRVTDPLGKTYTCEIDYYPEESISGTVERGPFGWQEKRDDDPLYNLRRMLYPLKGADGLQALYTLFYPPSIYPHNFIDVMHVSSRKRRPSVVQGGKGTIYKS